MIFGTRSTNALQLLDDRRRVHGIGGKPSAHSFRWRFAGGKRRDPTAGAHDSSRHGRHVMLTDVRYALRLSGRSPLASLAIVTTMALGIAATTAVFGATNAVLLKPLPFPESDRVVQINGVLRADR